MKYLTLFAAAAVLVATPACQIYQPSAKLTIEGKHGPECKQINYKLELSCQ